MRTGHTYRMVNLLAYCLLTCLVYTPPIVLVLWLGRKRISRAAASLSLAAGFAAVTAFSLWRMEWFDVWRHGAPPLSFMLTSYGPPIAILACVGAALGAAIAGRKTPRSADTLY